jgi:hypothetical protein
VRDAAAWDHSAHRRTTPPTAHRINHPAHVLDVGGRRISLADIAYHLGNKGLRELGTTEVVEALRLLRAGYEQGTLRPATEERTP